MNQEVNKLKKQVLQQSASLKYDLKLISKSLDEAIELHKEHKRKSGEPYIIHPLSVALEVLAIDLGSDAVAAALLHDTIEDCGVDATYLSERFNPVVATLVDGVTKLDEIADKSTQRYTELMNLRKFLISTATDIRVLLIKLADRLHNMRTIDALKPEKQVIYADETLKVYVPLAEYIGMGRFKRELEDIAFRKKEPEIYSQISAKIQDDKKIYDNLINEVIEEIEKILKQNGQKYSKIYGRIKSVHSTYNKIHKHYSEGKIKSVDSLDISKIKDLIGISIILDTDIIDCYKVLGLVHSSFEHLPKDFDDYIARPKPNGYRSLQTTILFEGKTAEIQIKTQEMHDINEFGPASHLAYKLSGKSKARATTQFGWIRNLSLWSSKTKDHDDKYKLEAFSNKIFVITPKGKVVELSKGATSIDFAYAIHSAIGNRYTGVKINGVIGKASSVLSNGDVVEILTSKNPKAPSAEWLQIAYSSSTKAKIRKALMLHETESVIQKGKDDIADYVLKTLKIDWFSLDTGLLRYICSEIGVPDIDRFYIGIKYGNISKKDVVKLLIKKLNLQVHDAQEEDLVVLPTPVQESKQTSSTNILIEDVSDLEYKIAGCCKPLKGDEIIGIVTLRDGLKIHRVNCPNLDLIEEQRRLNAKWV